MLLICINVYFSLFWCITRHAHITSPDSALSCWKRMTSSHFAATNLCQCECPLILMQLSVLRPYCPVNLITLIADSECPVDLKLRGSPWNPYSYCMMFSLSRAVQRRDGREWAIVAFIMLCKQIIMRYALSMFEGFLSETSWINNVELRIVC